MQTHPREDVLAGDEILVVRLVHVPQQRDFGHVLSWANASRRASALRVNSARFRQRDAQG
jgi:hypothetical protein